MNYNRHIATLTAESAETFTKFDLRKYEDNSIVTFGKKTVNQRRVITS